MRIGFVLLVLAVCGAIVYGIYKGTRHPSVTITNVVIRGGETVDHAAVRTHVRDILRGSYFFVIPHTFAYLYPEEQIETAVSRIPRVRNVEAERTTRTEIEIRFTEYPPFGLWCSAPDASSTTPCLFVDHTGYAFAEAPMLTGAAFTRFITEDRPPEMGASIAAEGRLRAFAEFKEALNRQYGLRIGDVTITVHDDIIYHLVGSGDIIVSSSTSVQNAFDALNSVFDSEEFKHLASSTFQYIDLRFGNRVYIKEEMTAGTSSEEAADVLREE